ncbi:MAG: hypothetical protein Q9M35_12230 [Rhodothermus sp.]|nr:hypothetical protein [Rhodothermus sp.]
MNDVPPLTSQSPPCTTAEPDDNALRPDPAETSTPATVHRFPPPTDAAPATPRTDTDTDPSRQLTNATYGAPSA